MKETGRYFKGVRLGKLTEAQQKIYDSIPTGDWFTIYDLSPFLRNRQSQCLKMCIKGYLVRSLGDDYTTLYFQKLTISEGVS